MTAYKDLSIEELEVLKAELDARFKEIKAKDLKLDMSRGKPSIAQLDLAMGMMDVLSSEADLTCEEGIDCRNYGVLDGIREAKQLLADMTEVPKDNIVIMGNSSLNIMYDTVARSMTHGVMGSTPWCKLDKVKFLCPSPGYDRHFAITEHFGIEMITVPMTPEGPDMVYIFCSTSKISFPGSGVAAIAASTANLVDIREQMKIQTIGHDKVNQLRHARFYKDIHGMVEHMRKHADILRPKFEAVLNVLDRELEGLEIGEWTRPRGGYFISFDSLEGCAKAIVAKAKEAGVTMTSAGATFPYGKDPKDSNIRIAPSFPTPEELGMAAEIFVLSVKLVSIEKILAEKTA